MNRSTMALVKRVCQAVSGTCVTDPTRPPCDASNCVAIRSCVHMDDLPESDCPDCYNQIVGLMEIIKSQDLRIAEMQAAARAEGYEMVNDEYREYLRSLENKLENAMDAETSKRLVAKVIELCNAYYEENQKPVPDHWHEVFATEALLALLNEEIKKRKEQN